MQGSDFSPTEFIETWNGISNMTFPESASQSLRNIIGKMSKKSGERRGKMLKCEICGCEFNAIIEKHYVSRDEGKTGFAAISGGEESIEYDTFDCPQCGCQHVAQPRKRRVNMSNEQT